MNEAPHHPAFDGLTAGMRLIVALGEDRPQRSDLDDLERLLGRPLPPDYRALQEKYGALYVDVIEEVWPRPVAYAVGPYWTFNYGFAILGLGHEVPDFLDVRESISRFREAAPERPQWLPVFRWFAGGGDYVCYDEDNRLVEWRHDDEPIEVGLTLDQYLVEQVQHLAAKKDEMIEMRAKGE